MTFLAGAAGVDGVEGVTIFAVTVNVAVFVASLNTPSDLNNTVAVYMFAFKPDTGALPLAINNINSIIGCNF